MGKHRGETPAVVAVAECGCAAELAWLQRPRQSDEETVLGQHAPQLKGRAATLPQQLEQLVAEVGRHWRP